MSHSDVTKQAPRRRLKMAAAKRRAAAQPYDAAARRQRHPRRSERLGGAATTADTRDDDEDVLGAPHSEETTTAGSHAPTSGSLFSRLFSYLPLVGKLVTEDTEETRDDDDWMDEEEEEEEENEEDDEHEHGGVNVQRAKATAPTTTAGNAVALAPLMATNATSSPNLTAMGTNAAAGQASPSLSPRREKSGETARVALKKRGPTTSPRSLGNGAETTKMLKIGDSFSRAGGKRRRSKPSPKKKESPLTVIKQRKPISFDEYERLASQLRSLVETTPDNAVALTRFALTNALNGDGTQGARRVLVDDPVKKVTGERSVAALPAGKRARPHDELPITLALPGSHEDRLVRKPRTSRLLTGTGRDRATRSAYSAAVAEKILSTLNKIQTPLVQESQKPTPSTSMSWAKYQLALSEGAGSSPVSVSSPTRGEIAADDLPPTSTMPAMSWSTVAPQSQVQEERRAESTPLFTFQVPSPADVETPAPKAKKIRSEVSPSFVFSPPSVSTTPVSMPSLPAKETEVASPEVLRTQFKFSLPSPREANVLTGRTDGVDAVQYFFSPPQQLREPPQRAVVSHDKDSRTGSSAATPYSFMPASPKTRSLGMSKSVTPKPAPRKLPVASASTEEKEYTPSPASVPAGDENPLARFMTLAPGSWKCPTCSVTNGAKYSKCPCCETDKPSASSDVSPGTQDSVSTPAVSMGDDNPLARFLKVEAGSWRCPSCAVMNGPKHAKCPCCETQKPSDGGDSGAEVTTSQSEPALPASGSIGSSGFTFGLTTVDEVKKSDASADVVSQNGFSFGVSSNDTSTTKSSLSGGFSFGVAPSKSEDESSSKLNAASASSGGFSFGLAKSPGSSSGESTSTKNTSASVGATDGFGKPSAIGEGTNVSPNLSFSFGVTSHSKRKADDSDDKPATDKKRSIPDEVSPPASKGFTFGVTSTSTTSTSSGFSFGQASSSTSPQKEAAKPNAAGSTFGSKTESAAPVEAPSASVKPSSASGFSFGGDTSAPMPAVTMPKPSFSFGGESASVISAETATTPSFSFGVTSAKEPDAAKQVFSFGATESKAAPDSSASKPSFTFGQVDSTKPASTSPTSTSSTTFKFGGESSGKTTSLGPSGAEESAKPSFTFSTPAISQSESMSTDTPSAPAFSFGKSASQAPSDGFVAPPSSKPAFTFGGETSSSESKAPSTAPGAAFTFGSDTTSQSAGSTGKPSFTFGAGTTQSGTTSFGTPASAGFGQTTSTSTGFGQPATTFGTSTGGGGGFGSTSTANPSFGVSSTAASPAAPAFSFGGHQQPPPFPASSSGFGSSNAPGSGFGSSSTGGHGSFGGAPSAPSFGSGPVASTPAFGASTGAPGIGGFGAGAFGAPTATQGAPGFGATPTGMSSQPFGASSGSAFGGPPQTANAFGGAPASTFGAPQSAGFGGPAPSGFGFSAPAPAASGFSASAPAASGFGAQASGFGVTGFGGAPQQPAQGDGGFSMGSAPAPTAPKGRRILKAKSRVKRQ